MKCLRSPCRSFLLLVWLPEKTCRKHRGKKGLKMKKSFGGNQGYNTDILRELREWWTCEEPADPLARQLQEVIMCYGDTHSLLRKVTHYQVRDNSQVSSGTKAGLCLTSRKCFVTFVSKLYFVVLCFLPLLIKMRFFIIKTFLCLKHTGAHTRTDCGAICVLNSRWFMRSCVSNVGLSIYLRLIN